MRCTRVCAVLNVMPQLLTNIRNLLVSTIIMFPVKRMNMSTRLSVFSFWQTSMQSVKICWNHLIRYPLTEWIQRAQSMLAFITESPSCVVTISQAVYFKFNYIMPTVGQRSVMEFTHVTISNGQQKRVSDSINTCITKSSMAVHNLLVTHPFSPYIGIELFLKCSFASRYSVVTL